MTTEDSSRSAAESDAVGSGKIRSDRVGPPGQALGIEGLSKQFPKLDVPVLHDISLSVPERGFTTLIGPSGCGKTTLLRIVGGLTSATRGDIKVAGIPSMGPSRDKAMVFQHFNLFPWRTALTNVAYGLELQGVPEKERLERAGHFIDLVGLTGFTDHYPAELSGGMQQRVGIARALAVEPKLLLMDEPFGALDALTREHMQTELQKICAQAGVAVLFVTHSIDEAIFLSDHVIVMGTKPGRITAEFDVEFPRPRWTYDVRAESQYSELRSYLWSELEKELTGAGEKHTRMSE